MDKDEKAVYEMILRDLFAAVALYSLTGSGHHRETKAEMAYDQAKAMMRERAKRMNKE
jgi:hypothetical protein